MKHAVGMMCLGSLYAGALWIEYQTAVLLATGWFLLIGGSTSAVAATALYLAPEGEEHGDGFHIRRRRASGLLPGVRSSQRQMRRGWIG